MQSFNRGDAETLIDGKSNRLKTLLVSLCLCASAFISFSSCSSKPTDLRSHVPSEAVVYLESNDLAAALQPMIDSDAFKKVAKTTPDLSRLKGVQLAVAVTGFETSEERLNDETSVGRVQPNFVAVIETHAWNTEAIAAAERGLGGFIADVYGGEPRLEKGDNNGGKHFAWTSEDGRQAFALVIGSIIYFSNDPSGIEKCLAVTRGEVDSIAKSGKLPAAKPEALASGYISTDGVGQISALAAMQYASSSSDDEEVQSAVAGILPELMRAAAKDVSWVAMPDARGYEDKFTIGTDAELGPVLTETLAPTAQVDPSLFEYAWGRAPSVTLYNLEKPQIAWRGVLMSARSRLDPLGSAVVGEFSNAFAEPYGVADAELFLSGVGSNILTVRSDPEGEKPALIATVTNAEAVRRALSLEMKPDKTASDSLGFEVLKSEDAMAVFAGRVIITGDAEAVEACVRSKAGGTSLAASPSVVAMFQPGSSASTVTFDNEIAPAIADLMSKKNPDVNAPSLSFTQTRFTRTAIERRTTSNLGLIGWIAAQLSND